MNIDWTELIVGIVGALTGATGTAASAAPTLRKYIRSQELDPAHVAAVTEIARESAYLNLLRIHRKTKLMGYCALATRDRAERLYSAYTDLGGDGVGKALIDDIRAAPLYPPDGPPPPLDAEDFPQTQQP